MGTDYTVPSCTSDSFQINDVVLIICGQNDMKNSYIIGKRGIAKGSDGETSGDMLKAVYDVNDNGIVDRAENADKVNGFTVGKSVPANAIFIDTTYSEITEAEIDAGTATTSRVITGRRIKYILDKVQGWISALTKSDVGLGNVDNTSDLDKPISTATQTALNGKSDKGHVHDDRYYTETEVDNKLNEKIDSSGNTTITGIKTFSDTLKVTGIENFDDIYIKRTLGSGSVSTTYANLSDEIKNGGHHRFWKISFPTGASFWGKIKITLYGGYSSFNASGSMAKEINVNFNTGSIYSNVGCYTELSGYVEKDFRISEAIWNSETSQWEFWIYSHQLQGNNVPYILMECWARSTRYIDYFNQITFNPNPEFLQDTTYSNVKGNAAGQTLVKSWGDLPTYQNPYGETIASVSDLPTKLSQLNKNINFDERYYTESEIDTKLATKSDTNHDHDTQYEPKNSNIQSHISNKSNPHNTTKEHVGLGSVQNYSVATQLEAEIGTSDGKYMTPLKTKQAIDKFKPKDTSELAKSDVYTKTEVNTKLNDKVDNSRVLTDVPANAKFTDTVYSHPSNHSADMIIDGTTNKAYTATEKTKLSGIATDATKNDTDANLKNRANHTGTQAASTISDFANTVRGTVLTGLSISTNYAITTSDTVLSSLGKLQKQITDHLADGVKHITAAERTNWNAAHANTHTHSNKSILDGMEQSFTSALKTKLDGIATGAQVNVKADWNASSGDAQILNKPTIPTNGSFSLSGLSDTTISSPSNSQILQFNGTKWVNANPQSFSQAQANWNETNTASVQYIQNKPSSMPANGGTATNANYLLEADTRNTNETPQWYMTNRGRKNSYEFKTNSVIGLTIGGVPTYSEVSTFTSWGNSSGGYPVQLATNNAGLFYRTAANETTWNPWQKLSSTEVKMQASQPTGQTAGDIWLKTV